MGIGKFLGIGVKYCNRPITNKNIVYLLRQQNIFIFFEQKYFTLAS